MRILHIETNAILGKNIKPASSFWTRLTGFMFRKTPYPYDGIFFPKCNWVHNCFVRFPIDIVFVREDGKIVDIVRDFPLWRFSKVCFQARHTIEFSVGTLPTNIKVGDHLKLEF